MFDNNDAYNNMLMWLLYYPQWIQYICTCDDNRQLDKGTYINYRHLIGIGKFS